MTVGYVVAAALVLGALALAVVSIAWHHARPITDLRRRQLADQVDRYGVHDHRPPT